MTAAAITSDFLCKNECPIQGHTFLPNNKNGIMLFHIMMLSMKTAWKRESVNLSSMGKRKVSTFLANEEKKRLPKSGKDTVFFLHPENLPTFLKNVKAFRPKRPVVFFKRRGLFIGDNLMQVYTIRCMKFRRKTYGLTLTRRINFQRKFVGVGK